MLSFWMMELDHLNGGSGRWNVFCGTIWYLLLEIDLSVGNIHEFSNLWDTKIKNNIRTKAIIQYKKLRGSAICLRL